MGSVAEPVERERVEVSLLDHQWEALHAEEPHIALVTGLGGGKTFTGTQFMMQSAIEYPDAVFVITINSYPQGHDVIEPAMEDALETWGIDGTFKGQAKEWHLDNGARILMRSTERFDKTFRGIEIDRLWCDEPRDMSSAAANVLWGRMRGTKTPQCRSLWTTTPSGFDHIWRRFKKKPIPGVHRMIHARSWDNPLLPAGYLENLVDGYSDQEREQELEGHFVNLGGAQCYWAFNHDRHVREGKLDVRLPIFMACDFNPDPLAWGLIQQQGDRTVVLRDFKQHSGDFASMVGTTADWLDSVVRSKYRPRIIVNGDASGNARTAQTGKTDYHVLIEELRRAEFHATLDVPRANPPIRDRVNATNRHLQSHDGGSHVDIDPGCEELIADLEQNAWDDTGKIDKRDRTRTHWADWFGYHVHHYHRPTSFKRDHEATRRRMR